MEREEGDELAAEAEGMLALLPGRWRLEEIPLDEGGTRKWLTAATKEGSVLAIGAGTTRAKALKSFFENWRKGMSEPHAPAAGSLEELRLKLSIEGRL